MASDEEADLMASPSLLFRLVEDYNAALADLLGQPPESRDPDRLTDFIVAARMEGIRAYFELDVADQWVQSYEANESVAFTVIEETDTSAVVEDCRLKVATWVDPEEPEPSVMSTRYLTRYTLAHDGTRWMIADLQVLRDC